MNWRLVLQKWTAVKALIIGKYFKGTVARGFPLQFCFIKSTHRGPRTGSHIFPLLVAAGRCDSLLHLAVESQNLPLQNATGSQLLPLHHAAGSQILPLHDAAASQILPPHDAVESQILPLHDAAESQILPPHDAAENQILPLHDAAESQILPPHDAAESKFGSKESSLKTLEDSLGP